MRARERIIELVSQITTAREHLHRLEAEMDQLLPGDGRGSRQSRKGKRAPRGSLSLRVVQLLESDPKQALSVPEVAKRLDVASLPSLRKTVLRLAAQRKIQRRERGLYGARRQRKGE